MNDEENLEQNNTTAEPEVLETNTESTTESIASENTTNENPTGENNEKTLEEKARDFVNDVKDSTEDFKTEDVENNKGMAILCYLSFLVLIPYFAEKKSEWVKFHAKQGLNLFIYELLISLVRYIINVFVVGLIADVLSLGIVALSICGIVNVVNGKAKELPIINKIALIK